MITLNFAQAQELVKAAIAEKGKKYVYEKNDAGGCDYFRNGFPSCLVGHVLHGLGIGRDGTWPSEFIWVHAYGSLNEQGRLKATRKAFTYLEVLQANQDNGYSWGKSNQTALDAVKEMDESE